MKITAKQKLLPAVAMLLVSAICLTTASYAWFSMSNEVKASDISVQATATKGLIISATDGPNSYGDSATPDEVYKGKMKPASSADGKTFFDVDKVTYGDAGNSGAPKEDSTITDLTGKADLAMTEGENGKDGYYADFSFFIKSTGSDVPVYLKEVVVTSDKSDLNTAVRVALLKNSNGDDLVPNKTVYNAGGGDFYEVGDPKVKVGPIVTATGIDAWKGDATKLQTLTTSDILLTAKAAEAQQVTIRVWIEGQAANCQPKWADKVLNLEATFTTVAPTAP